MPIGATSYSDALNMGQKIVTEIKKRIRYKTMSSIEENNAILTRDVRGYLYDILMCLNDDCCNKKLWI